MVEAGSYGVKVLNQVKALQRALDKVAILMIEEQLAIFWPSTLESVDPEEREDEILEFGKIIAEYQGLVRFENSKDDTGILNEGAKIQVEIKE
jgi:DNA-binding FrmR family transcriptional regulator